MFVCRPNLRNHLEVVVSLPKGEHSVEFSDAQCSELVLRDLFGLAGRNPSDLGGARLLLRLGTSSEAPPIVLLLKEALFSDPIVYLDL